MKKTLISLLAAVLSLPVFAQGVDDVTLVVNGSAATKAEAVNFALRSAIEQAFGVFVSANTTILNDELVKDEIATVSAGNIKSYKELECATLPNGATSVTLQAVVSTKKLAVYAKSKGSSCELAGATLIANRKMMELNEINTAKAFENLELQLREIAPYIFTHKLHIGEPEIDDKGDRYKIPLKISVFSNQNTLSFVSLFKTTLSALKIPSSQVDEIKRVYGKVYKVFISSDVPSYFCNSPLFLLQRVDAMTSSAGNNFIIQSNTGQEWEIENNIWEYESFTYWTQWSSGYYYNSYTESGELMEIFSYPDRLPELFNRKKKDKKDETYERKLYESKVVSIYATLEEMQNLSNLELKQKVDPSQLFQGWESMSEVKEREKREKEAYEKQTREAYMEAREAFDYGGN